MSKHLFLLFCLMPFSLAAQQRISGKVMSKENKPIAYASIEYLNHKYGITTESDGSFDMQKFTGDSVKIFALGYKPKMKYITDTVKGFTVYLDADTNNLENVLVKNKRKIEKKFVVKNSWHHSNYLYYAIKPSTEIAMFIPNTNKVRSYIEAVRFITRNPDKAIYPIQVKLLTVNKLTGLPDKDLLLENNIIEAASIRKNTVLETSNANIEFPQEGVFVSLKFIGDNLEKGKGISNGFGLVGDTYSIASNFFYKYDGIEWIKRPFNSPTSGKHIQLHFSLEIGY